MAKRFLADNKRILLTITSFVIALSIFSGVSIYAERSQTTLKSKYEIIDLGGNTPGIWPAWHLADEQTLNIRIVALDKISPHKISVIKDAILSEKSADFKNSIMNTASNSDSVFYNGWKGALGEASKQHTFLYIPSKIRVIDTDANSDVTITLTNKQNEDGYSGYTKSIEGSNMIQGASITIYDVSNLSNEQLATITRHEMGHALGLAHSSAPDDLMHAIIMTPSFISPCDIYEIVHIYNIERSNHFGCDT